MQADTKCKRNALGAISERVRKELVTGSLRNRRDWRQSPLKCRAGLVHTSTALRDKAVIPPLEWTRRRFHARDMSSLNAPSCSLFFPVIPRQLETHSSTRACSPGAVATAANILREDRHGQHQGQHPMNVYYRCSSRRRASKKFPYFRRRRPGRALEPNQGDRAQISPMNYRAVPERGGPLGKYALGGAPHLPAQRCRNTEANKSEKGPAFQSHQQADTRQTDFTLGGPPGSTAEERRNESQRLARAKMREVEFVHAKRCRCQIRRARCVPLQVRYSANDEMPCAERQQLPQSSPFDTVV